MGRGAARSGVQNGRLVHTAAYSSLLPVPRIHRSSIMLQHGKHTCVYVCVNSLHTRTWLFQCLVILSLTT